MKLSKTEETIREALERGPLDPEGIADLIYAGKERPTHWRSSILAIMRILVIKTHAEPRPVIRSSGLGSGHKAEYQLADIVPTKFRRSFR